jgi:hypothetical protein
MSGTPVKVARRHPKRKLSVVLLAHTLVRIQLVHAGQDHRLHHVRKPFAVDRRRRSDDHGDQLGRELSSLDPHRQIDLLRCFKSETVADLPEIAAIPGARDKGLPDG